MEEKRRSIGSCAIHCFGSSKEKKSRYGIVWKVWNTCMEPICMETITGHTCLLVVRKNLNSIMKVLLVGFCGL